jgi:hypothetical protein
MPTTLNSALPYIFVMLLLYLTFEAHTAKERIWCSFRRKDKTLIHKWARRKKNGGWDDIEFEGGLYHVEPDRTIFGWKLLLGFFPIGVRCADFRHNSGRALDPDTFDNSYTPEQRKELNIADDIRDFANGNASSVGGKMKKNMLESLMPIIVVIGFLILGYLVFNMQKSMTLLGKSQQYIEQQIGVIRQQTNR